MAENDVTYVESIEEETDEIQTPNQDILIVKTEIPANSVEINLNDQNFKMSITLKDSKGNAIATSNEIDLPCEDVAVILQQMANYGDVVTHNASEFATSEQGAKADTAVQPSGLNDYALKTYVDTSIANAITTALNTEV